MLAPQKTYPAPNAVYAPSLTIGMQIAPNGAVSGVIRQMTLAAAYCDPISGAWTACGSVQSAANISFAFDASGNVIGLPADIASAAPQIAAAWAAIAAAIGAVNAIRKLV
jgi:hypothetical protein